MRLRAALFVWLLVKNLRLHRINETFNRKCEPVLTDNKKAHYVETKKKKKKKNKCHEASKVQMQVSKV